MLSMETVPEAELFSDAAKAGALNRFPEGSLDLFEAGDFTIACTAVSLLDQLAKGSYGTVYKARMAGALYAVKIEDFREDDDEQINLIVELSMLSSYPHPQLVRFYGAGYLPGEKVKDYHIFVKILINLRIRIVVDDNDRYGVMQTRSPSRVFKI
jgi:hypothetical protein